MGPGPQCHDQHQPTQIGDLSNLFWILFYQEANNFCCADMALIIISYTVWSALDWEKYSINIFCKKLFSLIHEILSSDAHSPKEHTEIEWKCLLTCLGDDKILTILKIDWKMLLLLLPMDGLHAACVRSN